MKLKTKDSILDSAETLFASHGFANTSLRMITARAGVNLASVNYHFGSKESLVEAVFARRLVPMNAERLKRLETLEVQCEMGGIPLEALIGAFIGPALELSRDPGGARFVQLLGRSYTEPVLALQERVRAMHDSVIARFKGAFARALPALPMDELYWRLHFSVGVLAYCMAGTDMMRLIASCRLRDPVDTDALTRRLTSFLAAGLRASPSEAENESLRPVEERVLSEGAKPPVHSPN